MDDEGNFLLAKVNLDRPAKPRLALVHALAQWGRAWMTEYFQLKGGVDQWEPADADQVAGLELQKEKHDGIMDEVAWSDVGELAALLSEAEKMGMPTLAAKRRQADPPKPPPSIEEQTRNDGERAGDTR